MKWLVVRKSFIDNHLREAGETVEYTPPPGAGVSDNLAPADKEAEAFVAANGLARANPIT